MGKPNIECHYASITPQIGYHATKEDGSYEEGDTLYDWQPLNFTVSVDNSGDGNAEAFRVRLLIDDKEHHDIKTHALEAGAQQWIEWYHDAVPAGSHTLKVISDFRGTIHESDEKDNTYTQDFYVSGATRIMTFSEEEGSVVEEDLSDKEWRAAGWTKADIQFTMHDVDSHGVEGDDLDGTFEIVLTGTAGHEAEIRRIESSRGGKLLLEDMWISPHGHVHLEGSVGKEHLAQPVNGGEDYQDVTDRLFIDVQRKHWKESVEAESSEDAMRKVGVSATASVDVWVVEASVTGSYEKETREGKKQTRQFDVHQSSKVLGLTITHPKQ